LLSFGLHLGHNSIFSKGPLGELVMISKGGNELTDLVSLLNFTTGLFFIPILIYVRYFVKDETELKIIEE